MKSKVTTANDNNLALTVECSFTDDTMEISHEPLVEAYASLREDLQYKVKELSTENESLEEQELLPRCAKILACEGLIRKLDNIFKAQNFLNTLDALFSDTYLGLVNPQRNRSQHLTPVS